MNKWQTKREALTLGTVCAREACVAGTFRLHVALSVVAAKVWAASGCYVNNPRNYKKRGDGLDRGSSKSEIGGPEHSFDLIGQKAELGFPGTLYRSSCRQCRVSECR
jgi:hypothetical protein